MFYEIAHIIRDKIPFAWNLIDVLNSWLFNYRFGGKLNRNEKETLDRYGRKYGMMILPMREMEPNVLADFFAAQPEEAYEFFRPHGFDVKSLKKLQRNKAFLAYVILDKNKVAAYCFIRAFFHGKGFRGRMVGIDYRGRGLGTLMNKLMNDVGFGIDLRLFETVSKRNVASYRSTISASRVKVIEKMENDELFLEIVNSKQ